RSLPHMPDALIAITTSPGPGRGSANSRSSSFRSPRKTTPRMVPPSTARPRDRNEERLYSGAGRRGLAGEDSRAARLEVAKQRPCQAHRARGLAAADIVRGVGIDPLGAIRPTTSSARTLRRGKTRTTIRVTATGPSPGKFTATLGHGTGILEGATRQSVTHRHTGGGFMR